jgi:hypothetical protein
MVALRKTLALLSLLALAVVGSGVAQAQAPLLGLVSCSATAVPPVVRAEGIAELVGDIVLSCLGTTGATDAPSTYLKSNISVSLNVNITNNIDFGEGSDVTDAVLIINENNCTQPSALGATYGGAGCSPPSPQFQDPQYGRLRDVNRLEWDEVDFPFPGVDIDPPGQGGPDFPLVTTVRVHSIRANASQLGVPDAATFPSTQITAFISITGPTNIPVNNNVLNVAVPILGLIVTPGDPVSGLQCIDGDEHTVINLEEGFATAFKTIGFPTFTPGNTQTESGYYAPGSNNGAGASQATRFILTFYNIPSGVNIVVPTEIDHADFLVDDDGDPIANPNVPGDELKLVLIDGVDSDGAGTGDDAGDGEVSLSSGFGVAVYEVRDADPFRIENCDVEIWFNWETDTENDLPAVGSGQMTASFAPLSTVFVADDDAPEPRFLDTSGDPATIITIARCTTTLLFPFVTNQAGFDTGLAISNTSKDWLGTQPQQGSCTIHYHGSRTGGGAAPLDQMSTPIAAGEQLIFTLSSGNAAQNIDGAFEFQGYIIAQCEFQYGHGFAFITDGFGGIPALAQGYLALVIPLTPDGRVPGVPNLHLLGESLSH